MDDPPVSLALELMRARLVVERPDRLGRLGEGRVVFVHDDMREQARDRAARDRSELAFDQRADFGLRLRDREIERQRRCLVGRALMAEQLIADLRSVPVRDHELVLGKERPQCLAGLAEVRALLRRSPALARPHQGVAAERDDCRHTSALSPMSPRSSSTSARVGSPTSWSR